MCNRDSRWRKVLQASLSFKLKGIHKLCGTEWSELVVKAVRLCRGVWTCITEVLRDGWRTACRIENLHAKAANPTIASHFTVSLRLTVLLFGLFLERLLKGGYEWNMTANSFPVDSHPCSRLAFLDDRFFKYLCGSRGSVPIQHFWLFCSQY